MQVLSKEPEVRQNRRLSISTRGRKVCSLCFGVCEREREEVACRCLIVFHVFIGLFVYLFVRGRCVCLVVVVFFVLMCWLCLMLLSRHMYLTVLCRFAIHVIQTAWCVGFI